MDPLHHWCVTPAEAAAIQEELSRQVIIDDRFKRIEYIAGADVGYYQDSARGAVVVLEYPGLDPVDSVVIQKGVTFPYRTGFLSFREIPVLLDAFNQLKIKPDMVLVDGQGIAHPRRFGIASHLGILLNIPAVGCAKSHLWGAYRAPGFEKGCFAYLRSRSEIIGAALRTRTGVNVIFVSPGHKISISSSIRIVLSCCQKYRLPEPIRLAHRQASGSPY